MKYNAEDILHQSFERKFRGYDPEQVHEFLQSMAREWDFFLSEITTLQTSLADQSDELKELRKRERGLLDALSTARELAREMEERAQQRSAVILSEAQARADKLIENAQRQQKRLLSEIGELRHQRGRLEQELRSVLDSHLRLLDEESDASADAYEDAESVIEESVSISHTGPTIHRRPRVQQALDEEQKEDGEGARFDARVEDADGETLVGVASQRVDTLV